jgi:hypothetical protein
MILFKIKFRIKLKNLCNNYYYIGRLRGDWVGLRAGRLRLDEGSVWLWKLKKKIIIKIF